MTCDALTEQVPERAVPEYLAILELATQESESLVDDALRVLLGEDEKLTAKKVKEFVQKQEAVPEVTAVTVEDLDLSCFDQLLEDREAWSGNSHGSESDAAGRAENIALAGVPGRI